MEVCHCDPLHRDSNGVTPLHVAAAEGQIEIVRYFISTKSCDPRVRTSENATSLDFAAEIGHEVIAKYLLDSYHCDVRLKNTDILRARKLAVANGHYNVSLHLQFIGEGGMFYIIMFLLIFWAVLVHIFWSSAPCTEITCTSPLVMFV